MDVRSYFENEKFQSFQFDKIFSWTSVGLSVKGYLMNHVLCKLGSKGQFHRQWEVISTESPKRYTMDTFRWSRMTEHQFYSIAFFYCFSPACDSCQIQTCVRIGPKTTFIGGKNADWTPRSSHQLATLLSCIGFPLAAKWIYRCWELRSFQRWYFRTENRTRYLTDEIVYD